MAHKYHKTVHDFHADDYDPMKVRWNHAYGAMQGPLAQGYRMSGPELGSVPPRAEYRMSGPEMPSEPRDFFRTTGLREYEGSYYGRPPIDQPVTETVTEGWQRTPEEVQAEVQAEREILADIEWRRQAEENLWDELRKEDVKPPEVQITSIPEPMPQGYGQSIGLLPPQGYGESIGVMPPRGYGESIGVLPPRGYGESIGVMPPRGYGESIGVLSQPTTSSGSSQSTELPGGRLVNNRLVLDESPQAWSQWRSGRTDDPLDLQNLDQQVEGYKSREKETNKGLLDYLTDKVSSFLDFIPAAEASTVEDRLYNSLSAAEFRGETPKFIRTRHKDVKGGSSAYGPVQITKDLMSDYWRKLGLTKDEKDYVKRFLKQADKFLKYGNEPGIEGYEKKYDYGGEGDLTSAKDQQLYRTVAMKLIRKLHDEYGEGFVERWRGKSRDKDEDYFNAFDEAFI